MNGFNLSEWALKHQALMRFFIVVLGLAGAWAYTTLGRAEDPDFTFKLMVVRTNWPGATAREVEQQVTDRIEKKLQETPYIDYVSSYSRPGESVVFVALNETIPAREVPDAWYQVRKKISDIRGQLPEGVVGPGFNDEFGDTFGTIFAFTADGFTHAELRKQVEDVRREILRIPDVAKAELIGVQPEKIYIEMSHRKLASLGLAANLIVQTLQQQNAMTPAGAVETGSDRVYLRVSGDFSTPEAVREIGVQVDGRLFRLGDIANVYRGYSDPEVFSMRFKGEQAIGLGISMAKGGDIIKLGQGIDATMDRVRAELPIGIDVYQVADQPKVVDRSIFDFLRTLAEAIAIVLAVSFLSLGMRTGIVVALSIPLVLAITFVLMKVFGIYFQRISLGALIIALGLLVDDAIIAVEMMVVKMEQGWDRFKAASYAYTSTAFPMLTGTLVTAAGFVPIGFARSNAGEYTFSIFAVVTIALLVSWVVAVIFTPYLGYLLLPDFTKGKHAGKHAHKNEGDVYQRPFYQRFRRAVTWCVDHRWTTIAATLAAFLIAVAGFRFVPQQFFPSSNRPELVVDLRLAEGASINAARSEALKFENRIKDDEGIVNFVTYVGGGSPRFYLPLDQQLQQNHFAQVVILTKGDREREEVRARIIKLFDDEFEGIRGRVNRLENGPPVGFPVQFRVIGEDPATVRRVAEEVKQVMRQNPSTRGVHFDWNELSKIVQLDIDQNKARRLGISSQELSGFLNMALSGQRITEYREGDQLIEIVGRVEARERLKLDEIDEINVPTASGRFVPLNQIANIRYTFEEPVIWRRDRLPAITVRGDIADGVQAPDVTNQINPMLDPIREKLPPGYRIDVGGTIESSVRSQASINAVMPVMILLMLTVLMVQLQSFSKTMLVFLTAPLGIIGVTLALLPFQVPFGFVAMLGTIALAGMIMRNSVILVDQIDQDVANGLSRYEAIIESAVRRLRPIVLTALAAILAMIPLSRSNFWGPMAVAIMGGLLAATALTLLFLPALYAAWFKVRKGEAKAEIKAEV